MEVEHLIRVIRSIEIEEILEEDGFEKKFLLGRSKGNREIRFHFTSSSFLHNQIRILVLLLVKIGRGEIPPSLMPQIVEHKSRYYTDKIAPPQGLYLSSVVDGYE